MIQRYSRSKEHSTIPSQKNTVEKFAINGDDIAGLQCSAIIGLVGILPLLNFRFQVDAGNLHPTKPCFKPIVQNVTHALWAYEISMLITQSPLDLNMMLHLGNYQALSQLTGQFCFFSDAFIYYLKLGFWLTKFHRINKTLKLFPSDTLRVAVHNYNNMRLVCESLSFETISKTIATLLAGRPDNNLACLFASHLQMIQHAFSEQKSLQEIGLGVLQIFAGFTPHQMPPMGLIRGWQLQHRSSV
jgi:hypothetical protein